MRRQRKAAPSPASHRAQSTAAGGAGRRHQAHLYCWLQQLQLRQQRLIRPRQRQLQALGQPLQPISSRSAAEVLRPWCTRGSGRVQRRGAARASCQRACPALPAAASRATCSRKPSHARPQAVPCHSRQKAAPFRALDCLSAIRWCCAGTPVGGNELARRSRPRRRPRPTSPSGRHGEWPRRARPARAQSAQKPSAGMASSAAASAAMGLARARGCCSPRALPLRAVGAAATNAPLPRLSHAHLRLHCRSIALVCPAPDTLPTKEVHFLARRTALVTLRRVRTGHGAVGSLHSTNVPPVSLTGHRSIDRSDRSTDRPTDRRTMKQ